MNLHRMRQLVKSYLPSPLLQLARRAATVVTEKSTPRYRSPITNWPGTLECCVAYTPNGGFAVPSSSLHRPAAQKILKGTVYEPETIEFMAANCGDGDIVHAGTYFGDFLPSLSRACAPSAKVWAFEPNKENFRCAAMTCAINDLHNVILRNAGLGATETTKKVQVLGAHGRPLGGSSRIVEADSAPDLTEDVAIEIVDGIVPADRKVTILQLDVEGYEREALAGSLSTIARCKPLLILETMPDEDWMSANIFSLGYKIKTKLHVNTVLEA